MLFHLQHARFLIRALIAIVFVPAVAAGYAWSQTPADDAVRGFVSAVNDYAFIHRRVEAQVGPIEVSPDPASINRAIASMAAAMRAERPLAQQGDLFTPAASRELRARIDIALDEHGLTAADVRAAEEADGVAGVRQNLRVNGAFPWRHATAMFPCLLEALPELPPELEYRVVGSSLVLIDVHASLIVDILPSALADPDHNDLQKSRRSQF